MYNPPYRFEVWDYDPIGGDDYGGELLLLIHQLEEIIHGLEQVTMETLQF